MFEYVNLNSYFYIFWILINWFDIYTESHNCENLDLISWF